MRILGLLLLVGCVSGRAEAVAETALHSSHKHTHMMDSGTIGGDEVFVFCRDEHERDLGSVVPWERGRTYDGACVTVICTDGRCRV